MENTENPTLDVKIAVKDYVKVLEQKINDLIDQQRTTYTPDQSHYDFEGFMSFQFEINKYGELLRKARERAISQVVYNQLMYKNQKQDGRKSSNIKDYIILTINPQPAVPFDKFYKAVTHFMSFSFIEYGIYCFEQRSKNSDWNGFHTHIFFKRCDKPSVILKSIERLFSSMVGNVHNQHQVNIMSRDELLQCKNFYSKYLQGVKKNKDKQPAVEQTILWRSSLGLKPYYTVGECDFLVSTPPLKKLVVKKCITDFE